jgi:hypothetical protein
MADKNGGPCPPISKPQETEKKDNRLAEVTEADFSAEESKEESA